MSSSAAVLRRAPVYKRHCPETTALYEVVRDNLDTLYAAIEDGALGVRLPKRARKEVDAYLERGLLCRGFAFSCKGHGFCPSCKGLRMCATAAHLIDDVLPEVALRPLRKSASRRAPTASCGSR
jgi:hypothetical protein